MKHLKERCIGCERTKTKLQKLGIKFNKEHVFAKWLIKRTGTDATQIRWLGSEMVSGLSVTIPLCEECNSLFGELESQISGIFDELENGLGITDYQAELLVCWMWKLEGINWHMRNINGSYSDKYTLRERVLSEIDNIRPRLSLCISIIKQIDPEYKDMPMGGDSISKYSGIFMSGVFSKLAIMVSLKDFDEYIPKDYSIYHLNNKLNMKIKTKVFFPKVGFKDDAVAVLVATMASIPLQMVHDEISYKFIAG